MRSIRAWACGGMVWAEVMVGMSAGERSEARPLVGRVGWGPASAIADDANKEFSSAADAARPPPTSPTREEAVRPREESAAGGPKRGPAPPRSPRRCRESPDGAR